jgi:hypothetical protein
MSERHATSSRFMSCRTALAAALVLYPVGFAANAADVPAPTNLCTSGETIVFSCSLTNGKIVSLCGSPDLSHDAGYLQYRYGRNPDSIGLRYPHKLAREGAKFKYMQDYAAKGGTSALSFRIGPYRYSLFSTTSALGFNGAGLIIDKDDHHIADLRCSKKTIFTDSDRFYQLSSLGLPDATGDVSYVGAEKQK